MGCIRTLTQLLLLLSLMLGLPLAHTQCPVPGCYGCNSPASTIRVTCAGGDLIAFPQFPSSVQSRVTELILRSNSISEISVQDLRNFTNLELLDVSLNNLSSIEEDLFQNNNRLMELDMSSNHLDVFPEHLFVNTQLNILNLQDNRIEHLSAETFTGLQDFSRLDLRNNIIEELPSDVFSTIGILDELLLRGNPLECDCHLRWIPPFLNDPATSPLVADFGACSGPLEAFNLTGVEIHTLSHAEDFNCSCNPECVHGECNTAIGECSTCDPGYHGNYCDSECPQGYYGNRCLELCYCQNGAYCDPISGECNCSVGWKGLECDRECDDGTYGPGCQSSCVCEAEHTLSCNRFNGRCNCETGHSGRYCEIIMIRGTSTTTDDSATQSPSTIVLSVGAVAGLAVGGTTIASTILIVIFVLLTILSCTLAKSNRAKRRVTQSLVQSSLDSDDFNSGTHESEECRAVSEEGRAGFAYSDSPPSYETVAGEREAASVETASVETANHCSENVPAGNDTRAESKTSFTGTSPIIPV